jgi:hypothetical protein
MKQRLLILLIINTFYGYSQETPVEKAIKSFSVLINAPSLHIPLLKYRYSKVSIALERKYQFSTYGNFSTSFYYGREIHSKEFTSGNVFGTDFGFLFGRKHLFEIGGGIAYQKGFHFNAKLGGRLDIGSQFFIRAALTPTVRTKLPHRNYFGRTEPLFFLSLGYNFKDEENKEAELFFAPLVKNIVSFQVCMQPIFKDVFSQNEETQYNLKELLFEIRFFQKKQWKLSTTLGYSFTKRHYFLPLGVHLIYGKKINFIELGVYHSIRFIQRSMDMENDMRMIQAELAYRLHLGKRLLVKVGYTPYWYSFPKWAKQNNRPNTYSFVHSIKIGIGYRFNRKISGQNAN